MPSPHIYSLTRLPFCDTYTYVQYPSRSAVLLPGPKSDCYPGLCPQRLRCRLRITGGERDACFPGSLLPPNTPTRENGGGCCTRGSVPVFTTAQDCTPCPSHEALTRSPAPNFQLFQTGLLRIQLVTSLGGNECSFFSASRVEWNWVTASTPSIFQVHGLSARGDCSRAALVCVLPCPQVAQL